MVAAKFVEGQLLLFHLQIEALFEGGLVLLVEVLLLLKPLFRLFFLLIQPFLRLLPLLIQPLFRLLPLLIQPLLRHLSLTHQLRIRSLFHLLETGFAVSLKFGLPPGPSSLAHLLFLFRLLSESFRGSHLTSHRPGHSDSSQSNNYQHYSQYIHLSLPHLDVTRTNLTI